MRKGKDQEDHQKDKLARRGDANKITGFIYPFPSYLDHTVHWWYHIVLHWLNNLVGNELISECVRSIINQPRFWFRFVGNVFFSFQYTKHDKNRGPYSKLFTKWDVIDLKSVRLLCTIVTNCVLNLVHNFFQSDFDIFSKWFVKKVKLPLCRQIIWPKEF